MKRYRIEVLITKDDGTLMDTKIVDVETDSPKEALTLAKRKAAEQYLFTAKIQYIYEWTAPEIKQQYRRGTSIETLEELTLMPQDTIIEIITGIPSYDGYIRRQILEYRKQGLTPTTIAARLGLDRVRVYRTLEHGQA